MARMRPAKNRDKDVWIVDYRDGKGKRHRKFFDRPAQTDEARTFYHAVASQEGDGSSGSRGGHFTIENLIDGYLNGTRHRRSDKSHQATIWRGQRLLDAATAIGLHYAADVTPDTLARLHGWLEEEDYAETTVYDTLSLWRSVCNYAVKRNVLRPDQPGEMTLRTPSRTAVRFLTLDEVSVLFGRLPEAEPSLLLPSALGLYQGLRRTEVVELTHANIKERQQLVVARSKGKRPRVLNLHPKLLPYLPGAIAGNGVPLCLTQSGEPWTPQWLGRLFSRTVSGFGPGWEDVTFHTLRHTCATQMLKARLSLTHVQRFLGHADIATTQRYLHLTSEDVVPTWG